MSPKPRALQKSLASRSIPPASPHRAGHYSGLHPEDQPYESGLIAVQRPPSEDEDIRVLPPQEPEHIVLPTRNTPPSLPPLVDTERVPSVPLTLNPAPYAQSEVAQHSIPRRATPRHLVPQIEGTATIRGTIVPHVEEGARSAITQPPSAASTSRSSRAIPVLLALSCIFFLLASSILAFVLIGNQTTVAAASLQVKPDLPLRAYDTFVLSGKGFSAVSDITFTYDTRQQIFDANNQPLKARTDTHGSFSLQMRVPGNWSIGEHYLHATDNNLNLSVSTKITIQDAPKAPPHLALAQVPSGTIDLGDGRAGTISNGTVTLMNIGGDQISWQGRSDATWLTLAPNTGSFHGSELVTIIGNRGSLTPQTYTGHITFGQKNGADPVKLSVTMNVNPEPAALTLSAPALTFSTGVGKSAPPYQSVTLQNKGGQTLNWGSTVSTTDGANWLFIGPATGSIEPGQNEGVTVSVQPQSLAAGQYQGTIAFTGGANAQVSVFLNVIAPAPGNLIVSLSSLTFNAVAGQNAIGKSVTLQNNGGSTLTWNASSVTNDKGTWLNSGATSGTLDPGTSSPIIINASAVSLKAGTYQGTVSFTAGGVNNDISVVFTVTPPPQPAISSQSTPLSFSTYKGQNPAPKSFALVNTGNAPLNWIATEDGTGATFAPISPAKGTLAAGASIPLTVTPNVLTAVAGTLTTTITIADSDAGSTVASQKMTVSIIVIDQANMMLSGTALTLNATSGTADTATLLHISNTGSQTLNWVLAPDTNAPWLTFDTLSGSIAPGAYVDVHLHANASQLPPKTYNALITISDSDPNSPILPQTIQVTFIVS